MSPEQPGRRKTGLKEQPDASAAPLAVAAPPASLPPASLPPVNIPPAGWTSGPADESGAASVPADSVTVGPVTPAPENGPEPTPTPRPPANGSSEPAEADATKESAPKAASKPAWAWWSRAAFAVLAATIMVVGLGILVLERDAIVGAASSLYAMVGLQKPLGAGLDIGGVTSFREETADGDVLVVEGTVTNVTDDVRTVPVVRVTLFNTEDEELQHVMVLPDQEVLGPGERVAFSARLAQPAPTARRIKVTFAAGAGPPETSEP